MTLEEKIKQLEEKQAKAMEQKAKADAAAKKATDDLKRVMKQAEAKEKEEAAKKEQAEALEFYRKYRALIEWMQSEKVWHFKSKDGTQEEVTRYEFCVRQMEREVVL